MSHEQERARLMRRLIGVLAAAVVMAGVAAAVPFGSSPAAEAATTTLFGTTTPAVPVVSDPDAVTVGLAFTTKAAGVVQGVRFYKGAGNGGTHVGALYDASGKLLTKRTFTSESASGWQSLTFTSPIQVAAGQRLTAAVLAPVGHYAVQQGFGWPRSSADLTGTAGVYRYGSSLTFPNATYKASNYFVDVSFARGGTTPTQPTAPAPTATAPAPTTPPAPSTAWPDASNTGVAGCPALKKVDNGDEVQLRTNGQVLENVEYMNPVVIRVLAHNVKIQCVKLNGSGYFGIDNTDLTNAAANNTDTQVDRVDISCRDAGQVIGILLQSGTVSRANVHNCDHMVNAGGDHLLVRDSYCHALTDKEVVHADCIQTLGSNDLQIRHNSLYSRDTSDILLGQEYGDGTNYVIDNNRLMSVGTPPPAYLLYISGKSTTITNNRFTRRYTYGPCTLNTSAANVTWSGNVWDDDGSSLPLSKC